MENEVTIEIMVSKDKIQWSREASAGENFQVIAQVRRG
jgi:hypothetical protein